MGLDTAAVPEGAARTKWNFHPFRPGLVDGHCIPVDPYYLVYKAEELGYHPQVILAGRSINDSMPGHVARMAVMGLNEVGKVIRGSKVLIMGLTYKEDVPDIRESPVFEIVRELKEYKVEVFGYDPLLSDELIEQFGVLSLSRLDQRMDAVIIAVGHGQFKEIGISEFCDLMNDHPDLIDVKGILDRKASEDRGMYYEGCELRKKQKWIDSLIIGGIKNL